MNVSLFFKILRDVRWPWFGAAFLLTLFEGFWVKITDRVTVEVLPAILKKISAKDLYAIVFEGSGKLFQAVLGGESVDVSKTSDLLSVGYVHPLPQTILMIWALGRGASAIAGEIERGTMELLVSQPVARWRIVVTQFIADLVTMTGLVLCMLLGTWLGKLIVPLPSADLSAYWKAAVLALCLSLALGGITYAISSLGRSRWRVLAWAFGIVLFMSLLNLFGQLWDGLAPYRPLSIFYYYQPQYAILKDQWYLPVAGMQVPVLAVLLGVAAVGYLFATWQFSKRDLPAPL